MSATPDPTPPAQPTRWLRARWTIDRVLSAVALVPAAPVAAALGVAIATTSPGGAIVRLPRVGRGGRTFLMWKLRTMRAGSATPQADGSALTLAGDQRITPVGQVLRRVRLDELPQLWNIVRGDMALLGPRPETPAYVHLDDPAWVDSLATRPGIAGPTQVMVHEWESTLTDPQAYERDVLPVKLAIDRWYVTNASPGLDIVVLVSLLQSIFGRRPTTWLHGRVHAAVPEAAFIPSPDQAAA